MMLRFVLLSLLFLAGAGVLGAALDRLSTGQASVYAVERGRIDLLLDRADEITCLGAGNSHGRAISFDALGIEGHQLWRAGLDLAENEYLLRALLPRLPHVRRVIFVLSSFSFLRDNSLVLGEDRRAIRRQLYAVVPGATWVRGDMLAWVGGRMETVARRDHWWEVIQVLAGEQDRVDPRAVAAVDLEGVPSAAINRRRCTPEQIVRSARTVRGPHRRRLDEDMLEFAPDTPDRCEQTLLRIVALCRDAGIDLTFVMPPVSRAYAAVVDRSVVADMRERMARLVAEHGVEFHDFREDPLFIDRAEWFMDADHLNRDGAHEFSRLRLLPLLDRGR